MKNLVWIEGRLSWPLFAVIVYACCSLLITDLLWRMIETPTETLLTFVVLGNLAVVAAAIAAVVVFRRRRAAARSARVPQAGIERRN